MKPTLLALFILCLTVAGHAQMFDHNYTTYDNTEYVVRYNLEWQQDSTNDKHIRYEEMLLFLGNHCSKFMSSNYYFFDTCTRSISNHEEMQAFVLTPAFINRSYGYMYQIFKDLDMDKITYYDYLMPTFFTYKEPKVIFDWQLEPDTDTIHGYFVRKAICHYSGRDWEAWYTPEIPYSDGPYKFNGLPGLILNIHDTHNHYLFSFISMEIPGRNLPIDLKEEDYMEVSKQKFLKAQSNYMESVSRYAKQSGMAKESVNTIKKSRKIKNNPIELDRE